MPEVVYKKKGNIAFITLNRPDSLNAISRSLTRELAKVWVDFRDDDKLWVAVLNGQGKAFCAGADIGEMDPYHWNLKQSLIFGEESCVPSRYGVYKPVIAALHGYIFGAGLWLALECDIRIVAAKAVFGMPEVRYNIPVMFAAYLSDYMPRATAAELLLLGDRFDAKRALELGLTNRVVPDSKLMSTATAMAEEMCLNGPLSVRATKEIFHRSQGMDFKSALKLTEELAGPVFKSKDFREAKKAFQEKRKPRWQMK